MEKKPNYFSKNGVLKHFKMFAHRKRFVYWNLQEKNFLDVGTSIEKHRFIF